MKIALVGYGRMGKAIEAIAQEEGHEIVLRITSANAQELGVENLRRAEVAIEFSRPETAPANIETCLRAGIPVVCGATGWQEEWPRIEGVVEETGGALLAAANFSIGVNLLFAVNRYLADLMAQQPQYELSMREAHHVHKLDAPSGTAIHLANEILKRLPRKESWVNGPTDDFQKLPILSEREGEINGIHEVIYRSEIDTLSIRHEAHSRRGFAEGALRAAEWIIGKKGVLGMEDMLGL